MEKSIEKEKEPPSPSPLPPYTLPYTDIKRLLPHREPFLFVDSIDLIDKDYYEASYTYKKEEVFFQGHFPGYPVVPGVILCETLAQAGGAALLLTKKLEAGGLFFFATIEKAKFREQVKPGDKVRLCIQNLRVGVRMIRQKGVMYKEDKECVSAEWMCIVGAAS